MTIGTGLLFGLFPALHSTRPDLLSTLKNQAGQPAAALRGAVPRRRWRRRRSRSRWRCSSAPGLFTKSLINVSRVDLGINVDHVVTFGVSPELNGYTAERSRGSSSSGSRTSWRRCPA